MKKIAFFAVFALLAVSCREDEAMKVILKELNTKPENIQVVKEEVAPVEATDDLVEFVKAKLPTLKEGMSTDQVFGVLELDTRFNGIVTSEGSKSDFTFYYELNSDYELKLTFDYSKNKSGAMTKASLDRG